jgi:hypothetical protein
MMLPTAFKKVSSSAAALSLECKQPTGGKNNGGGKDGKGRKKRKSEDRNGNILKNTTQPGEFKLTARESWKDNFASALPHNWPAWTDKFQMCARWHLKGNCFDNCSRAISHVMNDKFPDNKRAAFLTFLTKCPKEIVKKKD